MSLYEISSKISPWHYWCSESSWRWGCPQSPDQKFSHAMLISMKNWRSWVGQRQPKGQICREIRLQENEGHKKVILGEYGYGQICATGNALMQLELILFEFGQIWGIGNALMQLELILCKCGQICATGNALMQLESILCKFGRICATGNTPM